MKGTKLTAAMAAVIKTARAEGYMYEVICAYFTLNFGRVADVIKGRRYAEVPPAPLPPDFPALA